MFRSEVSFFRKNTFSVRIFLRNRPLTYFRVQTDYMVRLGAKLLRTKTSLDFASKAPEFVFPKNVFSFGIFLRNRTSPIFMAKRTIWQDPGHNCSGVKFCSLEKTRFLAEFFYETAPSPIFRAKRTIWRVWGKNYSGRKLRPILPRKLRNHFSHKQVFGSNFFTKPPPHLFSRLNGLYGVFGGKIVSEEKLHSILP